MEFIAILHTLTPYGIAWFALRALNGSPDLRFKDWSYPLTAMGFCLVLSLGFLLATHQWRDWLIIPERLIAEPPLGAWLAQSPHWANILGPILPASLLELLNKIHVIDLLNLGVVWSFVAVKGAKRSFSFIVFWLQKIRNLFSRVPQVPGLQPRPGKDDLFYLRSPGQGNVLRPAFYWPRRLLFWGAWLSTVLFVFFIVAERLNWNIPSPILPIIPVIILFECAWFLGGKEAAIENAVNVIDETRAQCHGDFRPLWEEYKITWPERLLFSGALESSYNTTLHATYQYAVDKIKAGDSVLVSRSDREWVDDALFERLLLTLARGKTVLVVVPGDEQIGQTLSWIRDWLDKMSLLVEGVSVSRIHGQEVLGDGTASILIGTAWDVILGYEKNRTACHNLGLVVLTNLGDAFESPLALSWAINLLRLKISDLQFVVFGEPREYLREAVQRDYQLDLSEIRTPRRYVSKLFLLVWRLEGEKWFQQSLHSAHSNAYQGAEPILAVLAWNKGVFVVRFGDQAQVPWRDYLNAVQNDRNFIQAAAVHEQKFPDVLQKIHEYSADSWFSPTDTRAVLFVRDHSNNLAATIDKWSSKVGEECVLNVVSSPYLLRDYFAAHLEYFRQAPFYPLSPKIEENSYGLARALMQHLGLSRLSEEEVLTAVRRWKPSATDAFAELRDLLDSLGRDDAESLINMEIETEFRKGSIESIKYFKLLHSLSEEGRFGDVPIIDEANAPRAYVMADVACQKYPLGQMHTIAGAVVRVTRHEYARDGSGRILSVRVQSATPRGEMLYRSHVVSEFSAEKNLPPRISEKWGSYRFSHGYLHGILKVETKGYYRYPGGEIVLTAKEGAQYRSLEGQAAREYSRGRNLFHMEFVGKGEPGASLNTEDAKHISATLALLINEMMPTLFPGNEGLIFVADAVNVVAVADSVADSGESPYIGRHALTIREWSPDSSAINLFIVQDSHADLGLTNALFEEWTVVFRLVYDYIVWFNKSEGKVEASESLLGHYEGVARSDSRKPFLFFGCDDLPGGIELDKTLNFLKSLNLDTNNSHIGQRAEFLKTHTPPPALEVPITAAEPPASQEPSGEGADGMTSEDETVPVQKDTSPGSVPAAAEEKKPEMACSFCGADDRVEYQELVDGRVRCAACFHSAVDNKDELESLLKYAFELFERRFGIKMDRRPVNVCFVDADDLFDAESRLPPFDNERLGLFSPPIRKIGTASETICLANGLPATVALAHLTRELTRIWQDDELNLEAMQKAFVGTMGWGMGPVAENIVQVLLEGHSEYAALEILQWSKAAPAYVKMYLNDFSPQRVAANTGLTLIHELLGQPVPRDLLSESSAPLNETFHTSAKELIAAAGSPMASLLDHAKRLGDPFSALRAMWPSSH